LIVSAVALWNVPLRAETPPRAEITVVNAEAHALSAPLRDFVPFAPGLPAPASPVIALRKPGGSRPGGGGGGGGTSWSDPDLQQSYPASSLPAATLTFDGIGANGSIPPDTNLAVGATQAVEVVNTEYAVYDKSTGARTLGPAAVHTIFTSLGGMCGSSDGGDPIVLYDQGAGRWLISQLEYNSSFSSNLVCVAVSTTSDATGNYNLYSFNFGGNFPDYPKFGVWTDAYYFSANMFRNGSSFIGAQACAFNRSAMLNGSPAAAVCFQGGTSVYSLLPAHLDGGTSPPAASPDFYLQFVSNALNLYKYHVDFATPANSTFTRSTLAVGSFHEACGGGACVPQSGTTKQLDSLGDRLMYRLSYRNLGSYESLLVNHSVQVSSANNQTGVRWYEIRNPGTTPTVYQQSTFSPDASVYRWMGSIAQDKQGNMLLGYSSSNASLFPAIGFTGRLASDPLNQMEPEGLIWAGGGSQTTYSRWGDYSSMAVDPTDDCTFWYATEYLPSTGVFNWKTHVASFKFAACH
jgi:hypothetical protein